MAAAVTTRARDTTAVTIGTRTVANGAGVDVHNDVRVATVTNRARIPAIPATVATVAAAVITRAVVISTAAAATTIRMRATTYLRLRH